MTYKLNPEIEKIHSPVIIALPDGTISEYDSGSEAAAAVFEKHYVVQSMTAVGDKIELQLSEIRMPDSSTWIGEEQTFF